MSEFKIVTDGFEDVVRSKLGVKKTELPDDAINNNSITGLAEAIVIKRVPNYASISDKMDLMFLETAVINYICYLLCPTMANRVKNKVSTIEVRWEKDKVKWSEVALDFLATFENALSNIESVDVIFPSSQLFAIAKMGGGEE